MMELGLVLINAITALLWCLVCIRFSAAYFSYFIIVAGISIMYMYYSKRKEINIHEASLYPELKYVLWGCLCFYGSIILDSIILQDIQSLSRSLEYASLTIPFFVFYVLRTSYDIDKGTKMGLLVSCSIIFTLGIYQWYQEPNVRIMSTFANPNHLATMVAIATPIIAYFFKNSFNYIERIGLAFLGGLGFFCMYLTKSRGGLVALVLGICFSMFIMLIMSKHLKKKHIMTIIAGIALVLVIGGGAFYHLQEDRNGINKYGGERLQMLEASYQMWNDHKLLGVGIDRWGENYYDVKYHPENAIEQGHTMPHNMPIYFFSASGILGGMGYLLFHGILFVILLRSFPVAKDKWLMMALLSIFIAFFIQGLVDTTIINKIPARIYFGLLGYGMAAYRADVYLCHLPKS